MTVIASATVQHVVGDPVSMPWPRCSACYCMNHMVNLKLHAALQSCFPVLSISVLSGAAGRGGARSGPGRSFCPGEDSRPVQFVRGQLYEPPQQRYTGGIGRGERRIQQPAHLPQQNRQQHHSKHHQDGHSFQQHGGENKQGYSGRGRGGGAGWSLSPQGQRLQLTGSVL